MNLQQNLTHRTYEKPSSPNPPRLAARCARDADSLIALSRHLALKAQVTGLAKIDGHKPSAAELDLQREMRAASDMIASLLPNCKAKHISDLTAAYISLRIIACRQMPDPAFIARQRDRLMRLWHSGDKTIEESHVYSMLSELTPATSLSPAHVQTLSDLRAKWIATLAEHNTFPAASPCERYSRLALIAKDNIDAYIRGNARAAKQAWYKANAIADPSAASQKTLTAYLRFIKALYPAVLTARQAAVAESAIQSALPFSSPQGA